MVLCTKNEMPETNKSHGSSILEETLLSKFGDLNISIEKGYISFSTDDGNVTLSINKGVVRLSRDRRDDNIKGNIIISTDKQDTSPSTDKGYSSISTEQGDESISPERGDAIISTEKENAGISSEKRDESLSPEKRHTSISSEKGDSSISTEKGDSSISTEKGDSSISTEKGDLSISTEKADSSRSTAEDIIFSIKKDCISIRNDEKVIFSTPKDDSKDVLNLTFNIDEPSIKKLQGSNSVDTIENHNLYCLNKSRFIPTYSCPTENKNYINKCISGDKEILGKESSDYNKAEKVNIGYNDPCDNVENERDLNNDPGNYVEYEWKLGSSYQDDSSNGCDEDSVDNENFYNCIDDYMGERNIAFDYVEESNDDNTKSVYDSYKIDENDETSKRDSEDDDDNYSGRVNSSNEEEDGGNDDPDESNDSSNGNDDTNDNIDNVNDDTNDGENDPNDNNDDANDENDDTDNSTNDKNDGNDDTNKDNGDTNKDNNDTNDTNDNDNINTGNDDTNNDNNDTNDDNDDNNKDKDDTNKGNDDTNNGNNDNENDDDTNDGNDTNNSNDDANNDNDTNDGNDNANNKNDDNSGIDDTNNDNNDANDGKDDTNNDNNDINNGDNDDTNNGNKDANDDNDTNNDNNDINNGGNDDTNNGNKDANDDNDDINNENDDNRSIDDTNNDNKDANDDKDDINNDNNDGSDGKDTNNDINNDDNDDTNNDNMDANDDNDDTNNENDDNSGIDDTNNDNNDANDDKDDTNNDINDASDGKDDTNNDNDINNGGNDDTKNDNMDANDDNEDTNNENDDNSGIDDTNKDNNDANDGEDDTNNGNNDDNGGNDDTNNDNKDENDGNDNTNNGNDTNNVKNDTIDVKDDANNVNDDTNNDNNDTIDENDTIDGNDNPKDTNDPNYYAYGGNTDDCEEVAKGSSGNLNNNSVVAQSFPKFSPRESKKIIEKYKCLTCQYCFRSFALDNIPKILPCGDNICQKCEEQDKIDGKLRGCPVCGIKTSNSCIGKLRPNYSVINLIEMLLTNRPTPSESINDSTISANSENGKESYFLQPLNKMEEDLNVKFDSIFSFAEIVQSQKSYLENMKTYYDEYLKEFRDLKTQLQSSETLDDLQTKLSELYTYVIEFEENKNSAGNKLLDEAALLYSKIKAFISNESIQDLKDIKILVNEATTLYYFQKDLPGEENFRRIYAKIEYAYPNLLLHSFKSEFPSELSIFLNFQNFEKEINTIKRGGVFLDFLNNKDCTRNNSDIIFFTFAKNNYYSIFEEYFSGRNLKSLCGAKVECEEKYISIDTKGYFDSILDDFEFKADSKLEGTVVLLQSNRHLLISKTETDFGKQKCCKLGQIFSGVKIPSKIKENCFVENCGIFFNQN